MGPDFDKFKEKYIAHARSIPRGNKIYIAFILLWTLFESWIKNLEKEDQVTSALMKHFGKTDALFYQAWGKIDVNKWVAQVEIISRECPLANKSGSSRKEYNIKDPKNPNLECLSLVLFRLRSNLIHGYDDPDNEMLYTACRDLLNSWLELVI